ncbi:hypothetical protein EJB05_35510 [Eragrostis curvula]|uniref:Uncharacterized protein n=1 Tax=Eragrostis curvula TaxID=38414 RepID=A0A5J9U6W7_9POAL|nr:hypothetical protein EJB05_35510 [Eragrostis curvula]
MLPDPGVDEHRDGRRSGTTVAPPSGSERCGAARRQWVEAEAARARWGPNRRRRPLLLPDPAGSSGAKHRRRGRARGRDGGYTYGGPSFRIRGRAARRRRARGSLATGGILLPSRSGRG